MDDTDTETLIALVTSILPETTPLPGQNEIIDALILANGDVNAAAKSLQTRTFDLKTTSRDVPSTGKRKRVDLDSWLNTRPQKSKGRVVDKDKSPSPSCPADQNHVVSKESLPVASTSRSPLKPPTNLMTVLRQPLPSPRKDKNLPQLRPLTLSTPEMIAKYTPCTLHLSVLPPDLACQLFYTMIDHSREWKRNKWWLFDRVVESPHLTSFFARKTDGLSDDETWQEAAQFWYNGRPTGPPHIFPPEMEAACRIVEEVVNQELRKRTPYKLEWGGRSDNEHLWRANVAASNCYQGGKESVGFHSDQLTYLGPYPTIASLSLGTRRNFSLREVIPTEQIGTRKAQTFNIPLAHNSLTIMHASCQEKFKHSIPPQSAIDLFRPAYPRRCGDNNTTIEPSNCRINITFRFYRPDFRPPSIPRCRCGVPTILRPDMKRRTGDETDRYFWTCYAGAQNDGKGCKFWKLLDMEQEGRGPCIGALPNTQTYQNIVPKVEISLESEQSTKSH